jgi:diguanylate cyclase (GGDEF)-like protein
MSRLPVSWSAVSSSVGRRTLGAFLFATLVPVAAIALFFYYAHAASLSNQSLRQTLANSESLGLLLQQNLDIATKLLQGVAADSSTRQDAIFTTLPPAFDRIVSMPLQGRQSITGRPLILAESTIDPHSMQIGLAIPLPATDGQESLFLIGWLNPNYLWNMTDVIGEGTRNCVLQANGALLHCPEAKRQFPIGRLVEQLSNSTSESFDWADSEGKNVTGFWRLPLSEKYESSPWIITNTARPQSIPLIDHLARLDLLLVILVLVLSPLLFAMAHIRKIMEPIDGLMAGVGRIAQRDFSHPIAEQGPVEFARLANSINSMSTRIRAQIGTLNSFSEIDRVLLNDKDIGSICESLIQLLTAQSDVQRATIVLLNEPETEQALVYRNHDGTTIIDKSIMRLSKDTIAAMDEISCSESIDRNVLTTEFLDALDVDRDTLDFPVLSNNHLRALLLVSTSGAKKELDTFTSELIKGCHERLNLATRTIDHERQLKHHASYDELTQLANKRLLGSRIAEAAKTPDGSEQGGAFLYIDLDGFKSVNDISGHAAGDRVLGIAGSRILKALNEDATVARIGGDEFAVLLPDIKDIEAAADMAEEIIHALNRPILFSGIEHQLGASIGIARIPDDGNNLDDLLFKSDLAMYEAKHAGRNSWKYYNRSMKKAVQAKASFEKDLRRALDREEFSLRIQPQIDILTGKIVGGEALLRWIHHERGPISPNEFIPLAEETGLINPIGEWVLLESARLFSRWRRSDLDIQKIAVNVSVRQFMHKNFKGIIDSAVAVAGEPGGALEVEITESLFASDARRTAEICDWLHTRGVSIAIDDFGTGYSSLSYLNALPFETLKIDRSFINKIGGPDSDTSVVDMIIDLAKHLDRKVVAEGVTSMMQLRHLREKGCEMAQGFLIAEPMLPDEFAKMLGETPFHNEEESFTAVLKLVDIPLPRIKTEPKAG